MPDIFLTANTRSAAASETRQRPSNEAPEQGFSASEGEFSRTLQTQIDERRQQERRSEAAPARPEATERPRPDRPPASQPSRAAASRTDPAERSDETRAHDTRAPEDAPEDSAATTPQPPAGNEAETASDPAAAAAAGNAMAAQVAAALSPKASIAPTQAGGTATVAASVQAGVSSPAGGDTAATGDGGGQDTQSGEFAKARLVATQNTGAAATDAKPASGGEAKAEPASDLRARPAPIREVVAARTDLQAQALRAEGAAATSGQGVGADSAPSSSQAISHAPAPAMSVRTSATSGAPTPTAFISTPADGSGFADEVGQRVVLFAGRGESKAELILTPAHLGRVEVSLTVSAEQATAQFLASSNAAREALEAAMPRLREMLAEAGIQLGESHVGTQSERQGGDGRHGGGFKGSEFAAGADTMEGSRQWIRQGSGMIDTFA